MTISPIQLPGLAPMAPVALAPLAGITDLPFRQLVARFGAGWVVSEMVASREMVQAKASVRDRAELGLHDGVTAVQIAGREAHWMAEAARMIEANGAKFIDINMGCPAKKVTGGNSGSALLKTPDLAISLIEAVVGAVKIPVTLKTRLGWDETCLNAADVARRAEEAGIQMVTIHGRTRQQFYKGSANWAAINEIVEAVSIPVIANGDILSTTEARKALTQSKGAGVMIGRGAQGRPWRLAQVIADLTDAAAPKVPTGPALVEMIAGHYESMLSFYGTELGGRSARKHLCWYMDDASTPGTLRQKIVRETDPQVVLSLLPEAFGALSEVAA